jgi:hypothetical protein
MRARGGDPVLVQAVFVPHPVRGMQASLVVQMQGSADEIQIRIYSKGFTLMKDLDLPVRFGPGWNSVNLQLQGLPNGLFFTQVSVSLEGKIAKLSKPGTLMILR